MLNFATEFPVAFDSTSTDFIAVVKNWVLGSPYTALAETDLAGMFADGEFEVARSGQRIHSLGIATESEQIVAVRNTIIEGDLEWDTAVVFSKQDNDAWVGVRTSRDSLQPASRLPAAKKPLIVRALLDQLGGDVDGSVRVSAEPLRLKESSIALAANLILSDAACHLPVVYVSCGFDGKYAVDVDSLASDVAGMAHVVLEPSRGFSRRLQVQASSQNAYGGSVGIFWPNATGRRVYFAGRQFENPSELKWAIVDELRAALLNRRALFRCTWEAAEAAARKAAYASLRSSGSNELSAYISAFDAEIRAKDARLADAEKEISRLGREVIRQQAAASAAAGINLRLGTEQDFFTGEILETVLDAILEGKARAPAGSRREHILGSISGANTATDIRKAKREDLKALLRGYRSLDASTRSGLEALGFSISEDGKHHKLVYQEDDRYTFSLAKSGSDNRGGLNMASDIAKRVY